MVVDNSGKFPYDLRKFVARLWGAIMPAEYGDDRLVIKLSSDDPVELDRLGEGLSALARQFERHLQEGGLAPSAAPAKLLVTDLKKSSIEIELAWLLALYPIAQSMADGALIWEQFFDRLRRIQEYLTGTAGRPANFRRQDAHDLNAFLGTVAGKRGARIGIKRAKFHRKEGRREVLAEFDFNEQGVADAYMKLGQDMDDFAQNAPQPIPRTHKTERNVPFIWFRTDREKGKAAGSTSDRGIVAKISDKPLPVFFASEMENQKDRMTKVRNKNPFDLVYIVDVAVEYDEEETARSLTILHIHQIIGGDDGDASRH